MRPAFYNKGNDITIKGHEGQGERDAKVHIFTAISLVERRLQTPGPVWTQTSALDQTQGQSAHE